MGDAARGIHWRRLRPMMVVDGWQMALRTMAWSSGIDGGLRLWEAIGVDASRQSRVVISGGGDSSGKRRRQYHGAGTVARLLWTAVRPGQGRGVDAEGMGRCVVQTPAPQSLSKAKHELQCGFRRTANDESSGREFGGSGQSSR